MKRKLFISLVIIFYCGIAVTPGHNLILNGNFSEVRSDNASLPANWYAQDWSDCSLSGDTAPWNQTQVSYLPGEYVNITYVGNDIELESYPVLLEKNKTYHISFDFVQYDGSMALYLVQNDSGCSNAMPQVLEWSASGALRTDGVYNVTVTPIGGGWHRLSGILTTSGLYADSLYSHLIFGWSEFGNYSLDNVVLYEIPAPPVITSFNSSLATGVESLLVNFDGSAIDPNGSPMTYTLIFDTNNSAVNTSGVITGNDAILGNHTYAYGAYTAKLIVSNDWNTAVLNAYLLINVAVKLVPVTEVVGVISGSGSPIAECFYNWVCTDWMPIECTKSGVLTRTCANLGTCTDVFGMPITNISCAYVEKIVKNQLLDVKLTLESNVITTSDKLTAWVTFVSFGTAPADTNLNFSVLDKAGNLVYSESDEKIIYTEGVLIKEFKNLSLANGEYRLALTLNYANVTEKFGQNFVVGEITASFFTTEQIALIVILLLGASNTILIVHVLRHGRKESNPVI